MHSNIAATDGVERLILHSREEVCFRLCSVTPARANSFYPYDERTRGKQKPGTVHLCPPCSCASSPLLLGGSSAPMVRRTRTCSSRQHRSGVLGVERCPSVGTALGGVTTKQQLFSVPSSLMHTCRMYECSVRRRPLFCLWALFGRSLGWYLRGLRRGHLTLAVCQGPAERAGQPLRSETPGPLMCRTFLQLVRAAKC